MYYPRYLLLILVIFLSLGIVSAEGVDNTSTGGGELANDLSSNDSIVIDDSNFNSYFDSEGYIISDDIKENSTIYLADIYNKSIILDIPLTLTAYNLSSVLYNTSIKIVNGGSGSNINNLNFNFSLGENKASPIYLDESFDNVIENNVISMDFGDESYYNVCGIYIAGACENNLISYNRILISSKSNSKHYVYAIQLSASQMGVFSSTYNPENNTIKNNMIDIEANHYASGIYLSSTIASSVCDNHIVIDSGSFAYGIVCEYNPLGILTLPSHDINITNNTITATSSMNYMIEVYDCYDVNIISNEINAVGNATYGICGYQAHDILIDDNILYVNSSDISLVRDNFDAMGSGHAGIYYKKDSYNINITNNKVLSYYEIGGDYSIVCDDTCTNISICHNGLTSNDNTYHGNDSINANAYLFNNTYFSIDFVNNTDYTVVTIYVNNNYYGNGSVDNPFNNINDALLHLKNLNLANKSANYKGIIYVSEGTYLNYNQNLRLYITDLNVEINGVYNKTIIDGANSHWFFEISKNSQVKLTNITFTNGLIRKADYGLIMNNGQLTVNNCTFLNSKIVDTSAFIYNNGLLKLSNNKMNLSLNTGDYIYNKGRIENPILNFLVNSLDENDRSLELYSNYVVLSAYLCDDSNNPISGGHINFFVESKNIPGLIQVKNGVAKLHMLISSFNDAIKVSGSYSNAYGNTIVNSGYIINKVLSEDFAFYVDNTVNVTGDGSKSNPFPSVYNVLNLLDELVIDNCTEISIHLSNGNYGKLDISGINAPIKIYGSEDTNVIVDLKLKSNVALHLCNLKFNGVTISNTNGNLFVDNCVFKNAKVNAIHSTNGNLTVSNSIFLNNGEAKWDSNTITFPIKNMDIFNLGGAIKNENGTLIISGSQFIGNGAVFGGAIYNKQGNLYIFDSLFKDNQAFSNYNLVAPESLGGAIYQYLGEEIIVSNTTFENNAANGYGGAFYSSGSRPRALHLSEITTSYTPFWMRESLDLENSPQKIYFINSNFVGNLAPCGGGAVYITDNLLTHYIGCNFDNNVAYSHDWLNNIQNDPAKPWIELFNDRQSLVSVLMSSKPDNLGGAISDYNLVILDSTFKANSAESGGAIITPTKARTLEEINSLPRDSVGVSFYSLGIESQSIYVADSLLLTAEDSRFLGISGWTGSYNGPSISRTIQESNENYNTGGFPSNGNGNGGGNSHVDFSHNGGTQSGGSQGGSSNTGNSHGPLSREDIYNMLEDLSGNSIVKNNGNIDISDLLNRLNAIYDGIYHDEMDDWEDAKDAENNVDIVDNNIDADSNNAHQSNEEIKVNGTTNNDDSSGGESDNGGDAVSVGESSQELTGTVSNDNPDASDNADVSDSMDSSASQDSSALSSPSSPSSSASESVKAYEISKKIDEPQDILKSQISIWIVIFIVLLLLIIGYYRKRDDD